MGIGSWPRPRWLLRALHERMEHRLSEVEFGGTADDAVRLAVDAQLRAGVDVVTDGEQRRDSYASFVAGILDNCQLIPLTFLLAAGAALVQFDEPVLTEVVFTGAKTQRSFMCGALSGKGDPPAELAFARDLLNAVVAGFPSERTAVHVCRGNWTTDESACLSGGYQPLLETLGAMKVGTLFLELCTPRAGEMEILRALPDDVRLGVGVVNQKLDRVESVEVIVARMEAAIVLFGPERLYFNPDCGFATFADNPVSSSTVAEARLHVMSQAAERVKQRYQGS